MPSLWGLHLLPLGLSDTFILSFNNVSLPHSVCVCLDAFSDRFFFLLCSVCLGGGCDYAEEAGAKQWRCVSNYSGTEPIDQPLQSNLFTTDV